jgi:hypothetical protein
MKFWGGGTLCGLNTGGGMLKAGKVGLTPFCCAFKLKFGLAGAIFTAPGKNGGKNEPLAAPFNGGLLPFPTPEFNCGAGRGGVGGGVALGATSFREEFILSESLTPPFKTGRDAPSLDAD